MIFEKKSIIKLENFVLQPSAIKPITMPFMGFLDVWADWGKTFGK
jgi:hypothetical protein